MRLLFWLIGLPLAAIIIIFALSNRDPVNFGFWPFEQGLSVPLYLAVLLFLLLGLIVGSLLGGIGTVRARLAARREARRAELLKRELDALKSNSTAPQPVVMPLLPPLTPP